MLLTLERSLINTIRSKGRKTDPCGTPERTSTGNENMSKMRTADYRLVWQLRNQFT
jgi:mRNA-degrading endonuclease RelE of RelBE toxin-antitoxin system